MTEIMAPVFVVPLAGFFFFLYAVGFPMTILAALYLSIMLLLLDVASWRDISSDCVTQHLCSPPHQIFRAVGRTTDCLGRMHPLRAGTFQECDCYCYSVVM